MTEVTNELMHEILKDLQSRADRHETLLRDIAHGQLRLREDLHNFHGDSLRLEAQVAALTVRLDRIESRLSIAET